MEKPNDEQMDCVLSDAITEDADVSLGKFKDAQALLNAYNSLQAEFTRRCQRIKELEGRGETVDKTTVPTDAAGDSAPQNAQSATDAAFESGAAANTDGVPVNQGTTPKTVISDEEKEDIIKEYLKNLMGAKTRAPVITSGGNVLKTPSPKPKTVSEAGVFAKEILSKKH